MTTGGITPDGRARVLADGNQMPMLGLGVWQVPDGAACVNAVRWALELGYRHIRHGPGLRQRGERRTGAARQRRAAPRGVSHDEVPSRAQVLPAAAQRSGRRSRAEPAPGSASTRSTYTLSTGPPAARPGHGRGWSRRASVGLARSIGVSNFGTERARGGDCGRDDPSGRQPGPVQPAGIPAGLLDACRRRKVAVEAYSPLGNRPAPVRRNRQAGLAQRTGRTRRAGAACAGASSTIFLVIPKSAHRERIAENAQIFDFALVRSRTWPNSTRSARPAVTDEPGPGRSTSGGQLWEPRRSAVAEGLAQVIEQVVAVLDADRQPDQVAGHLEGRAGDRGVRHPRRVLDQ